jgi:hypothetical protein
MNFTVHQKFNDNPNLVMSMLEMHPPRSLFWAFQKSVTWFFAAAEGALCRVDPNGSSLVTACPKG